MNEIEQLKDTVHRLKRTIVITQLCFLLLSAVYMYRYHQIHELIQEQGQLQTESIEARERLIEKLEYQTKLFQELSRLTQGKSVHVD